MLSIENIIKLHDMGFSYEQIENINGLQGFEPEPNQDPVPEPNQDPVPEPNQDPVPEPNQDPVPIPGYNELSAKLDAMTKAFQAAMILGSEQPKDMGVDDILSVILSPSGEPLK